MHRAIAVTIAIAMCACIIPDAHLEIQPERTNPGAVRLVREIPLTEEINAECRAADPFQRPCPVPPPSLSPGLVRQDDGGEFCVCPSGQQDANAVGEIEIYAEDPDVDERGLPLDDLYAALLLDLGADPVVDVTEHIAYENYLNPLVPAELAPGDYTPIERPKAALRRWTIGFETGFDLCNDNRDAPLLPGLHSLRIIATDRPWYTRVLTDEHGRPRREHGAWAREDETRLPGVPDLAAGATYDTADYVFRCLSDSDACNCIEALGP